MDDPTLHFAKQLPFASPERLALAIAHIAYPDLDADEYLDLLDKMSAAASPRVAESPRGGARALALIEAMRLDLDMRGNTERYYDASNSYLNIVLDRRTGLPIMLSLILVAIGRRLGLHVEGVSFPGHFMARYEDEEGVWFLDPFHSAVMRPDDVPPYFVKLFGQRMLTMDQRYFGLLPASDWALRILNNLHGVYLNGGELGMLAKVLPLMLVLEPNRQEWWQELGLVEYRLGEFTRAARALRRYFYLQGHVMLRSPNSSVQPVPSALEEADRQIWSLLEDIEAARTRWN